MKNKSLFLCLSLAATLGLSNCMSTTGVSPDAASVIMANASAPLQLGGTVKTLLFTSDGKYLAALADDGYVYAIDRVKNEVTRKSKYSMPHVPHMDPVPNSSEIQLYAETYGQWWYNFKVDLASGKTQSTKIKNDFDAGAWQYLSPDGRYRKGVGSTPSENLVTGTDVFWNHKKYAYSPDIRYVATLGIDEGYDGGNVGMSGRNHRGSSIPLILVQTLPDERTFYQYNNASGVTDIAVSSGGRFLFIAKQTGSVDVVNINRNKVVLRLPIGVGVSAITLSPDNQFLYVGGFDGSVRVLSLDPLLGS